MTPLQFLLFAVKYLPALYAAVKDIMRLIKQAPAAAQPDLHLKFVSVLEDFTQHLDFSILGKDIADFAGGLKK